MAEPYCEPAEIKQSMPDTDWGETYDALLHNLAIRASRAIDSRCGWGLGGFKLSADQIYYFTGSGTAQLRVYLAQAPTKVEVDEVGDLVAYTEWANTEYICFPYNAPILHEPYFRLDLHPYSTKLFWPTWDKGIKITGRVGYSVIPPDEIIEASIIQAARWYKRGQQAFQDSGAITELGQLTYTKRLDPDVEEMLSYYTRMTI